MTAFISVESSRQVGMVPGMIAPNRRHLSHMELADADVAIRYIPMKGVSGDYYDLLPLHKEKTGLAVGDVCGKGIGAAFLTASLCANLRAQVHMESITSGEVLTRLNRFVHRDTPMHQFVTLSYGIWDAGNHTFTYSNAGHPPVLHYQAQTGCVRRLDAGGIVLGVCEETEYPTGSVILESGDALVMYTDGVTEATDESDEMFGEDRLVELLRKYRSEPVDTIIDAIFQEVYAFSPMAQKLDDITLVMLRHRT